MKVHEESRPDDTGHEAEPAAAGSGPARVADPDCATEICSQHAHWRDIVHKLVMAAFATAAVAFGLAFIAVGAWQLLVSSLGLVALGVLQRLRFRAYRRDPWAWPCLGCIVAPFLLVMLIEGAAFGFALAAGLLIFLSGPLAGPDRWKLWTILSLLMAVSCLLLDAASPLPRFDLAGLPSLSIFLGGLAGMLAILGALARIRGLWLVSSIRGRMLIAMVLLALFTACAVTIVSLVVGYTSGVRQAANQLEILSSLKAEQIVDWSESASLVLEEARDENIEVLRSAIGSDDRLAWPVRAVAEMLDRVRRKSRMIDEGFLLDAKGAPVTSTSPPIADAAAEQLRHSDFDFSSIRSVMRIFDQSSREGLAGRLVVVLPVRSVDGVILGYLCGLTGHEQIESIMASHPGVGESDEIYLVGRDGRLLTRSRFEGYATGIQVDTLGYRKALEEKDRGFELYRDYRGRPVLGVYRYMPRLGAVMLAEVDQTEVLEPIYDTLGLNLAVAVGSVLAAIIAAFLFSKSIARPIARLSQTTRRIAAGNLDMRAEVEREDEIGDLAATFNSMAERLEKTIGSLEDRIAALGLTETRLRDHASLLEDEIAERKRIEQALRESQSLLQDIIDNSIAVIFVKDSTGKYLFVNDAFVDVFSIERDNILGRTAHEVFEPDFAAEVEEEDDDILNTAKAIKQEKTMNFDGRERTYITTKFPLLDETGEPYALCGIHTDITERKHAEKALRESETRYRTLFEHSPLGIVLVDRDLGVVDANSQAAAMLGAKPDELDGQDMATFIQTGTGPDPLRDPALWSGETVRGELSLLGLKGEPIHVELGARLADAEHVQITLLDVSERKRLERNLREAMRQAEDANQAKSEFLANMSHEIRTPISGVIGMADLLMSQRPRPDQREYLQMLKDAARSLLDIINDILDFSKIEARKLELRDEDFELHKALKTTVKPFQVLARRRGVELRVDIGGEVPRVVHGDEVRLMQVVRNLVSNAVKFTSDGEIVVTVENLTPERFPMRLRVAVRDTGSGIEPDVIDNLFEKFTQGEAGMDKRQAGTGLGLAICRELVRLMGGEISVESEPGKGSVFTFTVTLAEPEQSPDEIDEAGETGLAAGPFRVLLAEDNVVNRRFLSTLLSDAGHQVTTANNGEEALEALARTDIDLVLMDVQMPGMDGVEATRAIRSGAVENTPPDLPVVALTAYALKGDDERFIEAGMTDYVSKPIDIARLGQVMNKVMAGRERLGVEKENGDAGEPEISPQPEQAQPPGPSGKPEAAAFEPKQEISGFLEQFEGRDAFIREMVALFRESAGARLAEVEQAVETASPQEAARAAHSLANTAMGVKAPSLVELSRSIESAAHEEDLGTIRDLVPRARDMVEEIGEAFREAGW